MLVFNLLVVLAVIVTVASGYTTSMRSYAPEMNVFDMSTPHKIPVKHFVEALHQDPSARTFDAAASAASPAPGDEWFQGGFMSLNYYQSTDSGSSATCPTSGEFIYTGINLGQCINDLNDSGNSYFFSCNSTQITFKSHFGPDCSPAKYNTTHVNINKCTGPAKGVAGVNQMFSCSTATTIDVPSSTFVNVVHDSNNCDSNTMGYLGFGNNKCSGLQTICGIAGQYSAFADTCAKLPPFDVSIKFSCDNPSIPSAYAYLGLNSCSGQLIEPKYPSTDCDVYNNTIGNVNYTQASNYLCTPSNNNNDGGSTASTVGSQKTGAIVGGIIGGIAAVAILYFAYTKFVDDAPKRGLSSQGTEL